MARFHTLVFALALAEAATGQAPPTGNSLPPPAKVIALNVIVRESSNQPVGDLGIDDFRVTDQGKQQKIIFFHRNEDAAQLAPVGPGEYSNRTGAAAPHAVAILFDLMNADLSYRGFGTDEIVRGLEHLKGTNNVYLYLLANTGMLYPVHPVPGSEDDLQANGAWTRQVKPLLDAAVKAVSGVKTNQEQQPAVRVEAVYRALETLATDMAPIAGRKDVLWISQGVPQVIRLTSGLPYDYSPQLQKVATALNWAGVSVNTVDQGNAVDTESKQTLDDFTNLTGGKSYPTRSVEVAVPEILASPAGSYLIEYAAAPPDGKFHKVRVNCARKGVRVQAPSGYSTAKDVPSLMGLRDAAVTSNFDAPGIGVWAAVSTKAPGVPHLEIRIDSRDLMLQPQGDGFNASMNIILVGYTAKGEEATGSAVNLKLTRAEREKPAKDDISISQDLPGGMSKAKIVVIDAGSNAIGSLTVPIK